MWKLKTSGSILTDFNILSEQKRFHQELYTSHIGGFHLTS